MQIQPTKLPYPELYSLEGAVSFVTNAIKYETFEDELHPPAFLLSPQSTLSFQAGDSLDMATLLVSILIGVGFDAYVVVGYAPHEIVRNDQSMAVCPLLEQEAAAKTEVARAAAAVEPSGTNKARYMCVTNH
jgi:transglutaminase-like putative cysteine protease